MPCHCVGYLRVHVSVGQFLTIVGRYILSESVEGCYDLWFFSACMQMFTIEFYFDNYIIISMEEKYLMSTLRTNRTSLCEYL